MSSNIVDGPLGIAYCKLYGHLFISLVFLDTLYQICGYILEMQWVIKDDVDSVFTQAIIQGHLKANIDNVVTANKFRLVATGSIFC